MMQMTREKMICCIMAVMLLLSGMCVESSATDSSFSHASEEAFSTIRSASYVADEIASCTTDMLGKGNASIRLNTGNYVNRGQSRIILLFLYVGAILQYLLYYQSSEHRENGQILLCRSVAVDYIHQKDGGK